MLIRNKIERLGFLSALVLILVNSCSEDAVQPEQRFGDTDVFVSTNKGSNTNSGALDSPFLTIERAIQAASDAGGGNVNVAAGTYAENITLVSGVNLLGGFDDTNFERDIGANVTIIEGDGPAAITGQGVTNVKVEGFTITNTDVPSSGDARTAAVVVHLHDCTSVVLTANTIRAGSVLKTGTNGAGGGTGTAGNSGGAGFSSTLGGFGGSGAIPPIVIFPPNVQRIADGGRGGAGGNEAGGNDGEVGGEGAGGNGGIAGSGPHDNGSNGGTGPKGPDGAAGDDGLAFGSVDATGYKTADGENGNSGGIGFGGGGAGGASGGEFFEISGGGGGGGSGGLGGGRGTGAVGGGASIGVLVTGESSVTVSNNAVETGNGGRGGNGGSGAAGGAGGTGGAGGGGPQSVGGRGGTGGQGGTGGPGGAGGGGPTVGIVVGSGSSATMSNNFFTTGTPGQGGLNGNGVRGNDGEKADTKQL
jgi:hypothetical protein